MLFNKKSQFTPCGASHSTDLSSVARASTLVDPTTTFNDPLLISALLQSKSPINVCQIVFARGHRTDWQWSPGELVVSNHKMSTGFVFCKLESWFIFWPGFEMHSIHVLSNRVTLLWQPLRCFRRMWRRFSLSQETFSNENSRFMLFDRFFVLASFLCFYAFSCHWSLSHLVQT